MKATYKIERKLVLIHCGTWDKKKQNIEKGTASLVEVESLATITLKGRTFYLLNYLGDVKYKNITCAFSGFSAFDLFIEFQQLKKTVEEFEEYMLQRWDKYLALSSKFKINKNLPITKWTSRMITKQFETTPVWLF